MNGAESLMRTFSAAGVDLCLANPGTTEMPLVAALDTVAGIRAVLGLFESVCTGAADGYARMSGKPALTLLHLGPGLANGVSNLHNARRAHSPVINLVGDQASWHLEADAPLTSDIASLARPVSGWVRSSASAASLASDGAAAMAAAMRPPRQVATLIIPHDAQWDECEGPAPAPCYQDSRPVETSRVSTCAETLRKESEKVLYIGGSALGLRGLRAAARVRAASGCRVMHEIFPARMERGAGLPAFERLPYFPEQIMQTLEGVQSMVVAGTRPPVSFFAYQGLPSIPIPEQCEVLELASAADDAAGALESLADALGAGAEFDTATAAEFRLPSGPLNADSMGMVLAALQPEGAVVMDEGATSSLSYSAYSQNSRPHTLMTLTGGSLGQGLPCAVGAALACPDRRVISLAADGSSMYSLQALWTMARESLDITVVICANRAYRILQYELARAGIVEAGPRAQSLTDLTRPNLEWVSLAQGMGVPAASAQSAEDFASLLKRALEADGPFLIEALI